MVALQIMFLELQKVAGSAVLTPLDHMRGQLLLL